MTALGHPVTWAGPRPLWSNTQGLGGAPAILRFAHDDFMDELNGLLATDPGALAGLVARYETWRSVQGEADPVDLTERVPLPAPIRTTRRLTFAAKRSKTHADLPAPAEPAKLLKLYQPVHMRHYVVCATLACRQPGFPDRKPAGPHEQIGYVLRRLLPDRDGKLVEHAFIKQSEGAVWQRLAGDDPEQLAPGEDRIKLFPLAHRDGSELRRTLWGAVIPVGRREEYLAADVSKVAPRLVEGQIAAVRPAAPAVRPNSKQARLTEFKLDFSEPWKAMIQSAVKAAADLAADKASDVANLVGPLRQKRVREANLGYQQQSWLLLVDLYAFLERHLPEVAKALYDGAPGALSGKQRDLYVWFAQQQSATRTAALANGFASGFGPFGAGEPASLSSMAAALKAVSDKTVVDKLDAVPTAYIDSPDQRALWPGFHFLLAGIASNGVGGGVSADGAFMDLTISAPVIDDGAGEQDVVDALITASKPEIPDPAMAVLFGRVDKLVALVGRALPKGNEANARPLPFAMKLAQTMRQTVGDSGRFVIRFIHLNEDCGPLDPPTLSVPSVEFELASFFDPDAPARPIRITLPSDTSPAGLRKHARGTGFVLSNMLCGQVQRAKGLGFIDLVLQVLPWPFHKDIELGEGEGCKSGTLDIGMICSISIPLITLCALILLMIIVTLLDFIFRWLPWFVICFPVPGLKGKKIGGAP